MSLLPFFLNQSISQNQENGEYVIVSSKNVEARDTEKAFTRFPADGRNLKEWRGNHLVKNPYVGF